MAEEVKKSAGRPKKEDAVVENNTSASSDIMDILKAMQLELASLKKENETLKQNKTVATEDSTLTSDTEVEVMSLFSGVMTLFTEGFGKGTPYHFDDGFGSVIDIPMIDLKSIVKNNNEIAKEGYFYILNEEAVNAVRLKKAYESLLSADKLLTLDKMSDEEVLKLFESAPKSQKTLIVEYFTTKYANKEKFSRNLLYQLGELIGKKILED